MNQTTKIAIMVVTTLSIGYFAGVVTQSSIQDWYPTLNKPAFNPPNWIFAPVWSILYTLMGVSAGLVWTKLDTQPTAKAALITFSYQLAANLLWSVLFFGLKNPLLAAIEILILWLLIFETYSKFKSIHKIAAMLLLPYLAWVAFATILNISIWFLNR